MKDFSRKNYHFNNLSLGQKLVYSAFLFFMLAGWLMIWVFYATKSGWGYQSLVDYYRGNEARFLYGKSFLELWEVTHFHLFTMPVVFLILIHLFILTRASNAWKVGLLLSGSVGMVLDIASPWLIVYVAPPMAWLKLIGRILLNASFLFLMIWPLGDMWLGGGLRRQRGWGRFWKKFNRLRRFRRRLKNPPLTSSEGPASG